MRNVITIQIASWTAQFEWQWRVRKHDEYRSMKTVPVACTLPTHPSARASLLPTNSQDQMLVDKLEWGRGEKWESDLITSTMIWLTSFSMFVDLVREDKNTVSWTSSYSCLQIMSISQSQTRKSVKKRAVSNSSLKYLFSEAGNEAMSADRERRVVWSGRAWPKNSFKLNRYEKSMTVLSKCFIPAITSVTYLIRIRIRSCNILTADLWVCRCDSTEQQKASEYCVEGKQKGKSHVTAGAAPSPSCSPIYCDTFGFTCFHCVWNLDVHGTRFAISKFNSWFVGLEGKGLGIDVRAWDQRKTWL